MVKKQSEISRKTTFVIRIDDEE